jgi:hypothetical protein
VQIHEPHDRLEELQALARVRTQEPRAADWRVLHLRDPLAHRAHIASERGDRVAAAALVHERVDELAREILRAVELRARAHAREWTGPVAPVADERDPAGLPRRLRRCL